MKTKRLRKPGMIDIVTEYGKQHGQREIPETLRTTKLRSKALKAFVLEAHSKKARNKDSI